MTHSPASLSQAAARSPRTSGNGPGAEVETPERTFRRAELAPFPRIRRERITPEQVGLPPGRRPHTPGLRREKIAHPAVVISGVAGLGHRWRAGVGFERAVGTGSEVVGRAVGPVESTFHLRVGITTTWQVMRRLGHTPQFPIHRAVERDEAAIAQRGGISGRRQKSRRALGHLDRLRGQVWPR